MFHIKPLAFHDIFILRSFSVVLALLFRILEVPVSIFVLKAIVSEVFALFLSFNMQMLEYYLKICCREFIVIYFSILHSDLQIIRYINCVVNK
jgi:hypothetical protein